MRPYLLIRLSVGWEGLVAAVTDRGSLVCWQDGEEGQPEVSRPRSDTGTTPASKGRSRFVAVAVATGLAVVALAEDGSLWSWKPKRMRRDAAAPDDLESVSWPCSRSIAQAPRIAEVSCGRRHVALRDCDGQAWTYGWGLYGQLGHGDSRDCETPTLVTATERHSDPGWGPCIRVACGGWHTAFLLCTAGVHTDTTTLATRLLTCGWNEGGQLGHTCRAEAGAEATSSAGSSTHTQAQDHTSGSICNVPTPVPSFDGIPLSGIACGSRFTLAATTAGELFAFGWSVRGELSRTLSSTHPLSTPSASKRKRGDTSRTQEDDSDDGQQYWHEPVCLTTEDEDVKDVCSSAATVVVDASSLSSGGWHASVGCDFD